MCAADAHRVLMTSMALRLSRISLAKLDDRLMQTEVLQPSGSCRFDPFTLLKHHRPVLSNCRAVCFRADHCISCSLCQSCSYTADPSVSILFVHKALAHVLHYML